MLPDWMIEEIEDQVEHHFGNPDPRLQRAAHELLDAGWPWEEIRDLLSKVYNAGFDRGVEGIPWN